MNQKLRTLGGYLSYNLYQKKLDYMPKIIAVELTNDCNYKCTFCPMNNKKSDIIKRPVKRKKTYMSVKDFELIINKYHYYMDVLNISHHGESLMHPELDKIVLVLKKYKVKYSITTNGSLLNKRCRDILNSYPPTSIMFSLYSVYDKSYSKICGNQNLDNVFYNLELFAKSNNNKTKLIFRTLNIPLLKDEYHEFNHIIDSIMKRNDIKNYEYNYNVLNSWAGRVNISKFDKDLKKHIKKDKYCIQPWLHVIIGSDCGVYICNNHEEASIGNIKKESLFDIWNSDEYLKIRQNILKGKFNNNNKICKECDYYSVGSVVPKPDILFFINKNFLSRIFYKNKDLTEVKK
jgi:radical SAM protein with 4Fe4S-binding SPASM domain